MAYIKKKVIAGQITEIKLYHTGKQRPRGEPRRKRGNETTAAMREVNRQNAEDRLRWLMCSNFKGGEDLHITLKYDGSKNHVATPDEMEKDIKRFIRLIRADCRQKGNELKYIYVFGIGERKSRHFHMIVNVSNVTLIQKLWNKAAENSGRVSYEVLYEDEDFSKLAHYFIKHSETTFDVLQKWTGQRYHSSRNLKQPIIKKSVITKSITFRNLPHIPDGYVLIDKYIKSGFDYFGYRYFEYRIRKLE